VAGYNEAIMRDAANAVEQFVIAGASFLIEQIVELNNEGGDGAPPAPVDTRQLRGSLRITVGEPSSEQGERRPVRGGAYPLTSARDARRSLQLAGLTVGDVIWGRWIAPYANIIEEGRRPDRNGRMIGSEQAPDGWVHLGIDVAVARLSHWTWDGEPIAA
jgi:hypothetical protein